jgi:hypothetical protein
LSVEKRAIKNNVAKVGRHHVCRKESDMHLVNEEWSEGIYISFLPIVSAKEKQHVKYLQKEKGR